MKLYNSNINKIENVSVIIDAEGNQLYAHKLTEAVRNLHGYYNIEYAALSDEATKKRASSGSIVYDKDEQGNDIATGKYLIGEVDKSLDELKAEKRQEITTALNTYIASNPISQTYDSGNKTLYIVPTQEIQQRLIGDITGVEQRLSDGETEAEIEADLYVYDNSEIEHKLTIAELRSLVSKIHKLVRPTVKREKDLIKAVNEAQVNLNADKTEELTKTLEEIDITFS